jgi:DUF4097 and DUF4098 domain-containing protein YvlB
MSEFPCSGPVTVEVRLAGGTVDLYAEPRESAAVEVTPYDSSDASQQAASETRVEMSGDTLLIAAPETSGWLFRRSPRVRVVARVPEASTAYLKVATADATIHGEWSQAKVNTASGDVAVHHVTGDLSVNTASGDVRAGRVGGQLSVNTASGDVTAQQVSGSVEVKGASADVEIGDLGGDLRSHTASGDMRIGTARQGTVRVNSASGDVSIGVASGVGVWLDLNTLSGRTNSDLNMTGDAPPTSHDLTIQVRTMSGDISIHRVNQPTAA